MDITDFKTSRFNIVGDGSRLQGILHLAGRSSISGEVEGELHAAEGSQLILEKTSRVQGKLFGHDVEIHGHFQGELHATGTLTLRPGSDTSGVIHAARLVVYPGALLNSDTSAG
jgi:cytoskeletal protein CcmA (bactofilin family)